MSSVYEHHSSTIPALLQNRLCSTKSIQADKSTCLVSVYCNYGNSWRRTMSLLTQQAIPYWLTKKIINLWRVVLEYPSVVGCVLLDWIITMYIFDQQDSIIRRFGSNGLNHRRQVSLYVTEQKGHRVWKFDLDYQHSAPIGITWAKVNAADQSSYHVCWLLLLL